MQLDALRWDDVAEGEEGLREEIGEVVEEDEKDSLRSEIERSSRFSHLSSSEERCEEAEERDQLSVER